MTCCIIGCRFNVKNAHSKTTSFHIFPHPEKEADRFEIWLDKCNNNNLKSKDKFSVYKQYRICRRHFAPDCFNGGCKRLLNSAIPSLFLNLSVDVENKEIQELLLNTQDNVPQKKPKIDMESYFRKRRLVLGIDFEPDQDSLVTENESVQMETVNQDTHLEEQEDEEEVLLQGNFMMLTMLTTSSIKHILVSRNSYSG